MADTGRPAADPVTGLPLPPPGSRTLLLFGASVAATVLAAGLAVLLSNVVVGPGHSPAAIAGAPLYAKSCKVCHGEAGEGGIGKNLTGAFVTKASDEDLVAFIKAGRTADDPANTTKVPMPPKGGNAALSDEELQQIVAKIRGFTKSEDAGSVADFGRKLLGGLLFLLALGGAGFVSANAKLGI